MTTNLETLGACVHLTQNLDPFRVLESSGCFVNRAGEEIEKRKGKGENTTPNSAQPLKCGERIQGTRLQEALNFVRFGGLVVKQA